MKTTTYPLAGVPTAGQEPDHEWDAFVAAHPAGHLLQTAGWGRLKADFGWRCRRISLRRDGDMVAGAQMLLRRAAGLTVAYVPRGPVVDWSDDTVVDALLTQTEEAARAAGAALLKLEPDLPDTPSHRRRLAALGFQPSRQTVQPPSTIRLDIGPERSDDQILTGMKSKWRYNIRLAARKGVTVRQMAREELPVLAELMQATGERDGFSVHTPAYYAAAFDLFVPQQAAFFLAEHDGVPLAAIVAFVVGDTAWYLWGASSDRERNRMPNHALQWAAIRWARDRGARRYDFWGIPDPIGQLAVAMARDGAEIAADAMPVDMQQFPPGELWGVYRFKQGFGGTIMRTVGAWDRPLNPVGYRLYTAGLRARDARAQGLFAPRALPAAAARRVLPVGGSLPADVRPVTDARTWNALLRDLSDPHVLQSWEWGEIKGRSEWKPHRFTVVGAGGRPFAAFQLLTRGADLLPLQIGYVPKGPVMDWRDLAQAEHVLGRVEATARALDCVFVKIDPNVAALDSHGRRLQHMLFRRGWRFSDEQIQFKNTAWSDLTLGEDALFAGMKSKWRYNVRLAAKRGISVRDGTESDLRAFYALYAETAARDGFLIRPEEYYRDVWATYLAAQEDEDSPAGGALLVAEHPDETVPLGGLFLMRYRDCAWYFYGASSDRRRRDMPNYLLQWAALRWSLDQGCTRYDWWGAPTDPDDGDDRMQGVWRFKQGFGAELQVHIGAWDFPVSPHLYTGFTRLLPRVREYIRRR